MTTPEIHVHAAGLIKAPGFYDMPAALYHSDPAPAPSASSSILRELLGKTPLHAYLQHPRLGNAPADEEEEGESPTLGFLGGDRIRAPIVRVDKRGAMDIGSVAHELVLGKGAGFRVVAAKNWRTAAAQALRAEILADGQVPILEHQHEKAHAIAAAVTARLPLIEDHSGERIGRGAFVDGHPEVAAFWHDPRFGCWCRVMFDWWGPTPFDVWNIKTTDGGLSDGELLRRIDDGGLHLQEMFYREGLSMLVPELAGRIRYRTVFVEQRPPHSMRVVELDGPKLTIGRRMAMHAAVMFGDCLERKFWPDYPNKVVTLDSSTRPWDDDRWLEREREDPFFRPADVSRKIFTALSPHAPIPEAMGEDPAPSQPAPATEEPEL